MYFKRNKNNCSPINVFIRMWITFLQQLCEFVIETFNSRESASTQQEWGSFIFLLFLMYRFRQSDIAWAQQNDDQVGNDLQQFGPVLQFHWLVYLGVVVEDGRNDIETNLASNGIAQIVCLGNLLQFEQQFDLLTTIGTLLTTRCHNLKTNIEE